MARIIKPLNVALPRKSAELCESINGKWDRYFCADVGIKAKDIDGIAKKVCQTGKVSYFLKVKGMYIPASSEVFNKFFKRPAFKKEVTSTEIGKCAVTELTRFPR